MSGRLGEAADSATAIVNASPATAAAVNPSSHPLMRRTWRDQVGRARTGGVSDLAEGFAGGGRGGGPAWRRASVGAAGACCSGGLGVAHYKKHLPGLAGAGRILRAAPPPSTAAERRATPVQQCCKCRKISFAFCNARQTGQRKKSLR